MGKVTLIRPMSLIPTWSDSGPITPPLGVAYLAASLREAGHGVKVIDAVGESPFQISSLFNGIMTAIGLTREQIVERIDPTTEVVGVSCMFSQDWPEVRQLINLVRDRFPKVKIVVGGEHITAVREFTLQSCPAVDCCVLGEGDEALVEIVNAFDNGTSLETVLGVMFRDSGDGFHFTGPRARIRQVDEIPLPAWDLMPIETYLDHGLSFGVNRGRSMPILATRGCPFQCTFCSNPQMWNSRWIPRDPVKVLDEIELYIRQYGAVNIDFYDLTAIVKRQWVIDFTHLILARGLKFTWQLPSGTRSEAIDDEVTRLLYQTGCRNLAYSPESGSPEVLKRIKKRVKLDHMDRSIRSSLRSGLNLKLNIVVGFPDETRWELWKTIRYLAKVGAMGVHDVSVSMFSPYPGSELYYRLRAQGTIPELSDEFFLSTLASYKDFSKSLSFANGIGSRELLFYRVMGMLVFYAAQYTLRPWRLVAMISNFIRKKQESRLDKSLQDLVMRVRGYRARARKPERQA
ncbi:MAG: Radical domain protein [Dehalococcoidia bacterium]|nr:Radical domain protein [Dehalococcoidia bacterium]